MHLRSLRDHFAKHNWLTATIDLLIVVLGVFLGMQVTNWNEERLERQQGRAYYNRILDDLDTDLAVFHGGAAYYAHAKAHAEAALAALRNPRARLDKQFLVDVFQATQIAPRPILRGAYDEAVSTGLFRSVGDAPLRDRISNYYLLGDGMRTIFDTPPPYRETVRRHMPYQVVTAILEACSDSFHADARGVVIIEMPETCDPQLTRTQIAEAVRGLRGSRDLAPDLNRHIIDLNQKLGTFALMITTAEHLRADMQAAKR